MKQANVIVQTKQGKRKTKQNCLGFEFKPHQVNDSSQSNQGMNHLVSQKGMEGGGAGCSVQNECDDNAAAIPIFQELPGERQLFDRNNYVMEPKSVYSSMKEFRLAMRQYKIEKKYELGIKATDKMRYRGYCHGGDYLWIINARVEQKRMGSCGCYSS
jgi:hypothetical protein